ncbi:MAG: phosphodiester glycosidase family protein [Acidobacteria bacterium]|jgi:hypothetical protein|nr:phosphodiester glycosidase family protein [Acidobacteriota bacterium]MCU0254613.1 phosphodiester glycosidase family protein [Acidobacteriota bacterium]
MTRRARALASLACAAATLVAAACGGRSAPAPAWQTLEPGLDFGEFPLPERSPRGDSTLRVLRVDPARFELKLFAASAPSDGPARTPREWAADRGLVAAINSSMFGADQRTAVSMLKRRDHVNNPRLTRDKTVLVFDRLDDAVPPVQLIDREAQDFDAIAPSYGAFVQGIRMIALPRRNVWKEQPRRHSVAAIGVDGKGRVLLIHCRSPYPVHDLADFLLALPLDLRNAMYAEGGPLAQLWIGAGGSEIELVGMSDAGFLQADEAVPPQPVPNVIGVARRAR